MKAIKSIAQKLTVLAAAMAALVSATSVMANDVPQAVKVIVINGTVRYMDQGSYHEVKVGMLLDPGVQIQTGEKSSMDVILIDRRTMAEKSMKSTHPVPPAALIDPPAKNHGPSELAVNTIHMFENTDITVSKLIVDRNGSDETADTELDLKTGTIFGNTKKMSAASKYNVKIPAGVAGIRGTEFLIGANGTITVLKGAVIIAALNAQTGQIETKIVTANEQFNLSTFQVTPLDERGASDGDDTHAPTLFTIEGLLALFEEILQIDYDSENWLFDIGGPDFPIFIIFISPR